MIYGIYLNNVVRVLTTSEVLFFKRLRSIFIVTT